MISVTDKASEQLKKLKEKAKIDSSYSVRISIIGGGCSGLSYHLDFDNEEQPGDRMFEEKGFKFLVNMKSLLYLAGTELDFSDGLQGKGFTFINPNASRTCNCGESFCV